MPGPACGAGVAELLHGTAISCGQYGVLLRGPPGSGKSDLALRCIGLVHALPVPGPVTLVADDQVYAESHDQQIRLRVPDAIGGMLEVRGVGIIRLPHVPSTRLTLVVELVDGGRVERLPEPEAATLIGGIVVPLARVAPFEAAAPLKVLLALDQAIQGQTRRS